MIIYKTLVEDILNKSLLHLGVNYVKFGNVVDIINDKSVKYPLVYLQPSESNEISERMITYNFKLFYLDQLQKNLENRLDILSEGNGVLLDIIQRLYLDYKINYDLSNELIWENFDESLCGWVTNLSIEDDINIDTCLLPFSDTI